MNPNHKWICIRTADIFPLKPCFLNVPVSDTRYGKVSRVERLEVVCGSDFDRAWAVTLDLRVRVRVSAGVLGR